MAFAIHSPRAPVRTFSLWGYLMNDAAWNPQAALRRAVPFFQALPHLEQASLTACGGETLLIWFDCDTSELVAETQDGAEVGRAHVDVGI